MENHKAIPEGYMTVGQIAKRMGITVRALHHYDKTGLLSPSSESEGGFRLYNYKDMVKLSQILSLKNLGFSLDDIKNRIVSMDTPAEVANMLTEHAAAIREKMETLSASLELIETLKSEVIQMQTVDFKRCADIIINLQMKNEHYWMIKYFDEEVMEHMRSRFSKAEALEVIGKMNRLTNEVLRFEENGTPPESEEAQALAREYWELMLKVAGGNLDIMVKMNEIAEKSDEFSIKNDFVKQAMEIYLSKQGNDYFGGVL